MRSWNPTGFIFCLFWMISNVPAGLWAQSNPPGQVIDLQAEYTFGGEITFQGRILSSSPVAQALVTLRFEGQPGSVGIPAMFEPEGTARAVYSLTEHPLRVFSNIYYRFEVILANGDTISSPEALLYYEDNRFQWQQLGEEPFEIYWYNGNLAFAQDILAAAQAGLLRAQDLLPLPSPENVKIYVYDNPQAMQAALLLSGQSWVAGHAHAELKVIQVSFPHGPEQRLEMERQIPHELMHVLLYQAGPEGYDRLPAWFNEGLASITELSPNPDYRILLDSAYSKGTLLPFASLCQVFPRDANGALLAYAQSASFTRYLYNQFGKTGLEQLHAQYAAGADCERGLEQALGSSLVIQENQWRQQTFTENLWLTALEGLLPWLVLLIVISCGPLFLAIRALRRRTASPALNQ